MLRNKLLLILGIAMVLLGLSAGSMAYFTSEATTKTNQISAGTMYIGNEKEERGVLDQPIDLTDLVPGEPETVTVKVKNLGTMPTYLRGISAAIKEVNEMFIANALKTTCSYQENELFNGSLLALDGNIVPFKQSIKLEPGEVAELELEIGLDRQVGNWYKGKAIEYTITIHAYQDKDQEIGGCAIIADESDYEEKISQANPGEVIILSAGNYRKIEIKVPGLTVKAKDVVYDVSVNEIWVNEVTSGKAPEMPTRIQGMTLNDNKNSFVVKVQVTNDLIISDNIIFTKSIAVNGGDEKTVLMTRNDLTGAKKPYSPGAKKPKAFYNLGDDLDPVEHAL